MAIAFIAQWFIIVPALLVAAAVVTGRDWKRDLTEALIAAVAAFAVVKIAGRLLLEQRPFVVERVHPLVAHSADNSFPSDHLAACGLAFAYLLPRSRLMALAVLVFAGAIAYARVAARLHWPADVICGFVFGALAAAFSGFLMRRLAPLP